MDISNLIDRVEFIRGHVFANDRETAISQIRELLDILRNEELKQLSKLAEADQDPDDLKDVL